MTLLRGFGLGALFALGLGACTPGYIKADDLEHRDQGPTACAKSCNDLHMKMVALVLVGDDLPGCVCQVLEPAPPALVPVPVPGPAPAPAPAPASQAAPDPAVTNAVQLGSAAASAGSYVVIAAAAAARQQQQQQQRHTH